MENNKKKNGNGKYAEEEKVESWRNNANSN